MSRETIAMRCITAGVIGALAACGSPSEPPPEYPPMETPEAAEAPVTASAEPAGQAPDAGTEEPQRTEAAPPAPVQVVSSARTPIEGELPKLRLVAPKMGQRVRGDEVKARVQLKNWELSPTGKHVHVIVDNQPYIAVRDVSQPLDLTALYREAFGEPLPEGTHAIRTFPSRGHHESVKQGTPFATTVFHYKRKTEGFAYDPDAPLLTYSRPKGCSPAGEPVLLDFYLSNVEIGADEARVRYTIDGDVSGDITEWTPHYIENLAPGEHTVRLQLVDAQGEPIPGPFNDTTRSIRVAADCSAPAPDQATESTDAD